MLYHVLSQLLYYIILYHCPRGHEVTVSITVTIPITSYYYYYYYYYHNYRGYYCYYYIARPHTITIRGHEVHLGAAHEQEHAGERGGQPGSRSQVLILGLLS